MMFHVFAHESSLRPTRINRSRSRIFFFDSVFRLFRPRPSLVRTMGSQPSASAGSEPASFDARVHWPNCNSIAFIRNQAHNGAWGK